MMLVVTPRETNKKKIEKYIVEKKEKEWKLYTKNIYFT